jgi:hypothetical protein
MKFEKQIIEDEYTQSKGLNLESYSILVDESPLITLDVYSSHFSIYWDGREISQKELFGFYDLFLDDIKYDELKLIVYGLGQRIEKEAKLPLYLTADFSNITKQASFVRVQTDYFAITADLIKPKFRHSPVMGVIADIEHDYSKSSLVELIAKYFQLTNKAGVLKQDKEAKELETYLLSIL